MLGSFFDCIIGGCGFLFNGFLGGLRIVVLPVFVVGFLHFNLLHVQTGCFAVVLLFLEPLLEQR